MANTNGKASMNGVKLPGSAASTTFAESKEYQEAYLLWKAKAGTSPETGMKFTTLSGKTVEMLYSPDGNGEDVRSTSLQKK